MRNCCFILALGFIFVGCDSSPSDQSGGADNASLNQLKDLPKGKAQSASDPNQDVIARVNGQGVTKEAFDQLYEQRVRTYRIRNRPVPQRLERTYKASVLQKLIDDMIIQQHLDAQDIFLSEEELQTKLKEYKTRFKGKKSYERHLENANKSEEDVIQSIQLKARTDKFLMTSKEGAISDEVLRETYERERDDRHTVHAQVRASHILFPVASNASKRQAKAVKKVARKAYRSLKKKDANFAKSAQELSADASTKSRGGDLGYFQRKGLPKINKAFEAATSKLKENEISNLVKSPEGWHIIKLTDRQPPQIKVSHILLKKEASQKRAREIYKRALTESFAALAKEVSEDENSRIQGGKLGFVFPKSTHRFGDIIRKKSEGLKEGEVLKPFKSEHGVHILKAIEVRPERLRVSQILIKAPKGSKKAEIRDAKKTAKKILDELKSDPKTSSSRFIRMAKKYSEDPSKDRGGDLGAFYLGGQPKFSHDFESEAFRLKSKELSKPVRSPLGWHIIKLTDKTEEKVKSFDEVRGDLLKRLQDKTLRQMKSKLLRSLRASATIQKFLETSSISHSSPLEKESRKRTRLRQKKLGEGLKKKRALELQRQKKLKTTQQN